MLTVKSADPAATFAFGRMLGRHLAAGDVVCLAGDLGAGKTLFVQGVADGLGVTDDVTSPTFIILQVYGGGRLPLNHFDLYRLNDPAELEDVGFAEYTGGEGVAVIEWADKFTAAMPQERLWIEFASGGENERTIVLSPAGGRYRRLCEELREFC